MADPTLSPEARTLEQLETATIEAAQLRSRLDTMTDPRDREIIRRQLTDTETRIAALQRRLRS